MCSGPFPSSWPCRLPTAARCSASPAGSCAHKQQGVNNGSGSQLTRERYACMPVVCVCVVWCGVSGVVWVWVWCGAVRHGTVWTVWCVVWCVLMGGGGFRAAAGCERGTAPPRLTYSRLIRQDSMATPGNFGEGEHRPGPDFSGHNEGANKCAWARARPEPCAAKPEHPNPQTTDHERHTRAARSKGFLFSKAIRGLAGLQRLCPVSVSQLRI
jgi:hypothetical protein